MDLMRDVLCNSTAQVIQQPGSLLLGQEGRSFCLALGMQARTHKHTHTYTCARACNLASAHAGKRRHECLCMYVCGARVQSGRHNYVTPTSYLELIMTFTSLVAAKRAEVSMLHSQYGAPRSFLHPPSLQLRDWQRSSMQAAKIPAGMMVCGSCCHDKDLVYSDTGVRTWR